MLVWCESLTCKLRSAILVGSFLSPTFLYLYLFISGFSAISTWIWRACVCVCRVWLCVRSLSDTIPTFLSKYKCNCAAAIQTQRSNVFVSCLRTYFCQWNETKPLPIFSRNYEFIQTAKRLCIIYIVQILYMLWAIIHIIQYIRESKYWKRWTVGTLNTTSNWMFFFFFRSSRIRRHAQALAPILQFLSLCLAVWHDYNFRCFVFMWRNKSWLTYDWERVFRVWAYV